jgi:uncharacterized protein YjbI with pentapeptide repeats
VRTQLGEAILEKAWLKGAHLKNAQCAVDQLTTARDWVLAKYDTSLLDKLGLPPDHNSRVDRKDLQGYRLAGRCFERIDFSGYDLRGADFRRAILRDARFVALDKNYQKEQANLEGIDFRDAQFEEVSFRECTLQRVDLRGVVLKRTLLSHARLEDCQVERANLQEAPGWLMAFYDRDLLGRLGFPEDHNDRVSAQNFSGYNLAGVRLEDALYGYNFEGGSCTSSVRIIATDLLRGPHVA